MAHFGAANGWGRNFAFFSLAGWEEIIVPGQFDMDVDVSGGRVSGRGMLTFR